MTKHPLNLRLDADEYRALCIHAEKLGVAPGTLGRILLTQSIGRLKNDATTARMLKSLLERNDA